MARYLRLLIALSFVLAACGGGGGTFPDGSIAVRANAELSVGPERVLIGIVGPQGERLGEPDTSLDLTMRRVDGPGEDIETTAEFIWIVPNAFGVYRANVTFSTAGTWEATVREEDVEPLLFSVLDEGFAPEVGEQAPRIATPTGADNDLASISTDPDPEPSFYTLSLDEALDDGRPTVIVFSTPRFCASSACGPMLDQVKAAAPSHPEYDFVHVEIYRNFDQPGFDPSNPENLAPAVGPDGYNLISEPWIFVTDASGVITARFEGVVSDGELADALG